MPRRALPIGVGALAIALAVVGGISARYRVRGNEIGREGKERSAYRAAASAANVADCVLREPSLHVRLGQLRGVAHDRTPAYSRSTPPMRGPMRGEQATLAVPADVRCGRSPRVRGTSRPTPAFVGDAGADWSRSRTAGSRPLRQSRSRRGMRPLGCDSKSDLTCPFQSLQRGCSPERGWLPAPAAVLCHRPRAPRPPPAAIPFANFGARPHLPRRERCSRANQRKRSLVRRSAGRRRPSRGVRR
jgi:hypothetical protein